MENPKVSPLEGGPDKHLTLEARTGCRAASAAERDLEILRQYARAHGVETAFVATPRELLKRVVTALSIITGSLCVSDLDTDTGNASPAIDFIAGCRDLQDRINALIGGGQ